MLGRTRLPGCQVGGRYDVLMCQECKGDGLMSSLWLWSNKEVQGQVSFRVLPHLHEERRRMRVVSCLLGGANG